MALYHVLSNGTAPKRAIYHVLSTIEIHPRGHFAAFPVNNTIPFAFLVRC